MLQGPFICRTEREELRLQVKREWELSPPQPRSKGDGIRVLGGIVEEQREPGELPSQPMCPSGTLTIQKKQTKHWRGSVAGAQHKPRFY